MGQLMERTEEQTEVERLREENESLQADVSFWKGVALIEGHPLRMSILQALRDDFPTASPVTFSKLFREPLGNVSYHAKELIKKGFVEVVDTRPRRGAVEHFLSVAERHRRR